jgi:hypothetical protein
METKEIWVLGVYISDRVQKISLIQPILTKFGCSIKTRLGLHETDGENYSKNGLILLELSGDRDEFFKLENELLSVEGLDVKKMVFRE